ncbi:type II toxin-antitoxin system RelE/ParE family toxin [Fulvivirgaceae bacterium PWU4]|uniref:Type II toxin-antitoxin system RelE/ParE family toxin n=1 Tax=Chryseosolibacter histidini TaxID=2782349 RepID=A0AAP2GQF3_9BACT|nr:type II toxin-antitoxin system RelE/ParE family toxin [Chryseosolibacter histidini]MBT1700088.1 type II toxin-antitoxin system RelE/ParE family toxin [Chryseosolibacter histidini]
MRKVWISERAEGNLDDILQYLEIKWSKRVREKFLKTLQGKIKLLSQTPLMYEGLF